MSLNVVFNKSTLTLESYLIIKLSNSSNREFNSFLYSVSLSLFEDCKIGIIENNLEDILSNISTIFAFSSFERVVNSSTKIVFW